MRSRTCTWSVLEGTAATRPHDPPELHGLDRELKRPATLDRSQTPPAWRPVAKFKR